MIRLLKLLYILVPCAILTVALSGPSIEEQIETHQKTCPKCDLHLDKDFGWIYTQGCPEYDSLVERYLKKHGKKKN